jgi:hypothetical protein
VRSRYTLVLQRALCDRTPPFLQEAARCQLSASSSTSRSGPTSSVLRRHACSGFVGREEVAFSGLPSLPGMANPKSNWTRARVRTILGLDCEKMTVGWTYGRFMVASSLRTGRLRTCTLSTAPAAAVVFCTTWVRTRPRLSHG